MGIVAAINAFLRGDSIAPPAGRARIVSASYTRAMRILKALAAMMVFAGSVVAQEPVTFSTADGGVIHGQIYGAGNRAVVLAHGGRYNKESWAKQAREIADAGFRVLAFDFRGYGSSRGPGDADPMSAPVHLDVLAAVQCLRGGGAKSVAVVGASFGGGAASRAAIEAEPGEIDRLVLLAAFVDGPPEKLRTWTLFIVARHDIRGDGLVRLERIREQYAKAPGPKRLVVLDGAAHAQAIFESDQAAESMREILRFLTEP
jgi:pimeloyl-ACP methyl ester carboxylesterase